MNRCIGYTKTNKKCRNLLKNPKYIHFCCDDHLPYNLDILQEGCLLCMETDIKREELKMLKCKHLVHISCFEEWKKHSTYDEDICIICRRELIVKKDKELEKEKGYFLSAKKVKIPLEKGESDYVYQYIDEKGLIYNKNSNLNIGILNFLEKKELKDEIIN